MQLETFTHTRSTYPKLLGCFRKRMTREVISDNIIFDLVKV